MRGVLDVELNELTKQLHDGRHWVALASLALARAAAAAEASGTALGGCPAADAIASSSGSAPVFVYLPRKGQRKLSTVIRSLSSAAAHEAAREAGARGDSPATLRASLAAPPHPASARAALDALLSALVAGASESPPQQGVGRSVTAHRRPAAVVVMPLVSDAGRALRVHALAGDVRSCHGLFLRLLAAWRAQADAAAVLAASSNKDVGAYYDATRTASGTDCGAAPSSYLPPPSSLAAAVSAAPIPPPHRPTVAAFNLVASALAGRPATAPLAWRVLAAAQAAPLALHATPRVALTAIGLYASQGRPDRAYALYEALQRGAAELARESSAAPAGSDERGEGGADTAAAPARRPQPPPALQAELAAFLLTQRPYLAPLLAGDGSGSAEGASEADGSDAEGATGSAVAAGVGSGSEPGRASFWQRLTRGRRAQRSAPNAAAATADGGGSSSAVHMILATVRPEPAVDDAWPPSATPSAAPELAAEEATSLLTAPAAGLLPPMPACPAPSAAFPLPLLLVSTSAPTNPDGANAFATGPQGSAAKSRADADDDAVAGDSFEPGRASLLRWDGGSGVQAGRLHPAVYSATLSALAGAPLLSLPQRGGRAAAQNAPAPPPPFSAPGWVFPRVSRVLGDLRASGQPLDAVTATALAGLCSVQGRPDAAVDVVASLEATAAAAAASVPAQPVEAPAAAAAPVVDTRLLTAVLQAYVHAATAAQPAAGTLAPTTLSSAALRAAMVAQRLLALAGWRLQSQPRLSSALSGDADGPIAAQAQLKLLASLTAPGSGTPTALAPLLRAPLSAPPSPREADALQATLLLPPPPPQSSAPTQSSPVFRLDRTAISVLIAAFAAAGHVPQVLALTEAALSLPREAATDSRGDAASSSTVARSRAMSAAAAARAAGDDGSGGAAAWPHPVRNTSNEAADASIAVAGRPAAPAGGMAAGDVVVVSQALEALTSAGLGRHAVELASSLLGDALSTAAASAVADTRQLATRRRFDGASSSDDGALPPDAAAALYRSYRHARALGRLHLDAGLYTAVMRACGSPSAGPPADALGLALSVHAAAVAANRAAYGWLGDDGVDEPRVGTPPSLRARRLQPVVFSEGTFSSLLAVVASAAHTAALLPAAFPSSAPRGWERGAARIAAETRRSRNSTADGDGRNHRTVSSAASHTSQLQSPSALVSFTSSRTSPPPSPLPSTPPVAMTGALAHLTTALARQMLALGLAPGQASFAGLLSVLLAHEAAVCAAAAAAAREAGADVAFPHADSSASGGSSGHAVTAPWLYALPDNTAPSPPSQAAARAATPLRRLLGTLGGRRLRLGRSPAVGAQVAVHVGTQAGGARKLWAARDAPALAAALLAPSSPPAVAPAQRLQPAVATQVAAAPASPVAPAAASAAEHDDAASESQPASPDRLHRYMLRLRGQLGDDARHLAASLHLHDGADGGGAMRRRLASALWAHIEAEEATTVAVTGAQLSATAAPLNRRDRESPRPSASQPSLALAAVAARSSVVGSAPCTSAQQVRAL